MTGTVGDVSAGVAFVVAGVGLIVFRRSLAESIADWYFFPFSRARLSQGWIDATRFMAVVIGVLCVLIGLGWMVGP